MKAMAKKDSGMMPRRREFLTYGVLVCALGFIWLATELGIIRTTVPIGPVVAIVIGLSILLPWIKK